MSQSLESYRELFPILSRKTYLASHSLGAVPRATQESLRRFFDVWADQGILAWDGEWWESVTTFNETVEGIIGAAAGTVAPMQNATRGMAAVASCFEYGEERNRIVMTDLEFVTSFPFWRGQEALGAEIVIVESEDGISVPVERLCAAIDERTLLVPTSHVYFRSGAIQDLGGVVRAAHAVGAHVLGDGYQAVGTVPVDVEALGIDFYVGGSHKWLCGGAGAGFLYVRPELVGQLRPRLSGWFGLDNPFGYGVGTGRGNPHETAWRFLGGTPNVPAMYAAIEGLKLVKEMGSSAIKEVQDGLTEQVITQADARGFEVRTPRDPGSRSGMVCLEFEGSQAASEELTAREIIVDWRPDCGLRVSPHYYNNSADIERFYVALDQLQQIGG